METKYLRLGSVCSKIGSSATPTGEKRLIKVVAIS